MSQRLDKLKQEDPILEMDLIATFFQNLAIVQQNLGIPTLEPLLQVLPSGKDQYDEALRNQFTLLIQMKCTR